MGDPYEVTYNAVYAQRIDSSGTKLWGDAGIELSPFVEGKDKTGVSACSDGNKGAFVFWGEDQDGNGAFELRGQRITSDGQLAWPDTGLVVTDNFIFDNISNPAVCGGSGNAIILYSDSSETNWDTKLQKLNSQGYFLWDDNSVAIYPVGRQMISDKRGGAIIAGVRWTFDGISPEYIVGAQRIDRKGQVLWEENGITITKNADDQTDVNVLINKDGNLFVIWDDSHSGQSNVYVQKLNPEGLPQWPNNGVMLSKINLLKGVFGNGIAPVETSNPVVIWKGWRNGDNDLFGQKLNSIGLKLWSDDVPISTREHYQRVPKAISDNSGGAIVCWYEIGTGSGWGIFAQQVSRNGNLGEVLKTSISQRHSSSLPSQTILHQSYPNPFNSEVIIKYKLSKNQHVRLTVYDITGKEVITFDQNQSPGLHRVKWQGKNQKGGEVTSGIYLYRLFAGRFVDSKKLIYVK
ncbi:MAG: T9SS type A sorting domain-containing protein [candidate division KSB1 bacterium]|nr:T9SS type A sorting domain-containing protein [candidate division KSB1 bacterium]